MSEDRGQQISEDALIRHLGRRELEAMMRDEAIKILSEQVATLKKADKGEQPGSE